MPTNDEMKEIVRQKYASIAAQDKPTNQSACCGSGGCSTEVYNIMSDSYEKVEGYDQNADLGLGCGLPTEFALIKKGDVVIDLGSGAGNDAFIARHETGPEGKVIGIDFTMEMIALAKNNADARGFKNVDFILGDIENMPVTSNTADVIVSNCVLNLIPNKDKVFKEIFRVLKPGGHFSISDVVLIGQLPSEIVSAAELYAGCISGAIQRADYIRLIEINGFQNIKIQKEKTINIPGDILTNYLSDEEIANFRKQGAGIYSITVYAEKGERACCGPECC